MGKYKVVGGRRIMRYDTIKLFDAEAIRDTSTHTSSVKDNRGYVLKTIAVCNKLNQSVTVQVQGSIDDTFTEIFNIGTSFNVSTSTNHYENASDYFSYIRITATCATAPTTGDLTVFAESIE